MSGGAWAGSGTGVEGGDRLRVVVWGGGGVEGGVWCVCAFVEAEANGGGEEIGHHQAERHCLLFSLEATHLPS